MAAASQRPCVRSAAAVIARRGATLAFVAAALLARAGGAAEADTPAGLWTTIDDATREARALVEIRETGGTLTGRIVRLFGKPGADPAPRCEDCSGARRGQPVVGMTILWDLHRHDRVWNGGEILDPESGRVYRASLRVVDGGARLEVRGFIGIALFGRTQLWQRAEGTCEANC